MTAGPIRNWEIVMLALQAAGAASGHAHTEDVTLKCFQIAPDAFSWLRHRQYPDKEVVRRDLIRLRSGQFGGVFVRGRAGITRHEEDGDAKTDGWQLTEEGVRWLTENEGRLAGLADRREQKATRQEAMKALTRVKDHGLYSQFLENTNAFAPSLGELADMLRCRVDAEEVVWASRFSALRNHATVLNDSDVLAFLSRCESIRPALR